MAKSQATGTAMGGYTMQDTVKSDSPGSLQGQTQPLTEAQRALEAEKIVKKESTSLNPFSLLTSTLVREEADPADAGQPDKAAELQRSPD